MMTMTKHIFTCAKCGRITTLELAKGLTIYAPPKHCGVPMQPINVVESTVRQRWPPPSEPSKKYGENAGGGDAIALVRGQLHN